MTIRDLAKKCNVSVSTVSRVLNNHPDVSAGVREKVLAAVDKYHYIPNASARDLVRTQPDSIGLMVRGLGNIFFSELVGPIEAAVEQRGYSLVMNHISSDADEILAGAQLVRSKRLQGIIFLGGRFDYTREQTAVLEVPFVCCTYTNDFGKLPQAYFSSVSIDDEGEACRAVKKLLALGHERIGILLSATGDASVSELRFRGYARALKEAGLPLLPGLIRETGRFSMEAAYAQTKALMASGEKFTALFVISDAMALAAMKALNEGGIRVPQDCAVVSIDGIEVSKYTAPTLSTFVQPKEELGIVSVNLLLDRIAGEKNRHVLLEAAFRQGGSLGEERAALAQHGCVREGIPVC